MKDKADSTSLEVTRVGPSQLGDTQPGQLELDFSPPRPSLPQLWTPDDIYHALDASVIALFKEDARLERKGAKVNPRDLGDYLSMYANTQPSGGVVLIGVENNGKLTGCRKLSTEFINKLEQVRNYCPDARHEFKRVPVKNEENEDDFVIALRIFYNDAKLVETTSGEAFVREGDEKRRLTE
jgi:ATP-dependent DNA helicase RecG